MTCWVEEEGTRTHVLLWASALSSLDIASRHSGNLFAMVKEVGSSTVSIKGSRCLVVRKVTWSGNFFDRRVWSRFLVTMWWLDSTSVEGPGLGKGVEHSTGAAGCELDLNLGAITWLSEGSGRGIRGCDLGSTKGRCWPETEGCELGSGLVEGGAAWSETGRLDTGSGLREEEAGRLEVELLWREAAELDKIGRMDLKPTESDKVELFSEAPKIWDLKGNWDSSKVTFRLI